MRNRYSAWQIAEMSFWGIAITLIFALVLFLSVVPR